MMLLQRQETVVKESTATGFYNGHCPLQNLLALLTRRTLFRCETPVIIGIAAVRGIFVVVSFQATSTRHRWLLRLLFARVSVAYFDFRSQCTTATITCTSSRLSFSLL